MHVHKNKYNIHNNKRRQNRQMKKNEQGKKIAIFVVAICCLTITLNHFYRHPLYERGVEMIIDWQSYELIVLDWFFSMITMLMDPAIIFFGAILLLVVNKNKSKAFFFFIFILLNVFLAAFLKAFSCDPRPIWTSDVVRNIGFYCPVEYGNPSGHSWFSAVMGFGILIEWRKLGPKLLNFWLSLFLALSVSTSRMYLGAHSLNQVLQGLTLGLALCLLYFLMLKNKIKQFLLQFNSNSNWKLIIVFCHVLYLIPFYLNLDQKIPQEWSKNISTKCPNKQLDEANLNYAMLCANALFINVATGIGLGYSSVANHHMGRIYLTGKWEVNEQRYETKIGYLFVGLIQLVCLLSGYVCAGVFVSYFPTKLVGFMGISAGGVVSGYLYTAKTIRVLTYFRLIKGLD